eukprot:gene18598-25112_t
MLRYTFVSVAVAAIRDAAYKLFAYAGKLFSGQDPAFAGQMYEIKKDELDNVASIGSQKFREFSAKVDETVFKKIPKGSLASQLWYSYPPDFPLVATYFATLWIFARVGIADHQASANASASVGYIRAQLAASNSPSQVS